MAQTKIDGLLFRDRWVVGDYGAGLQRYWLGPDGRTAVGLVHAYGDVWAYGFADYFYVLRGKYRDPATGATWTGRGREPKWIEGKDRAGYLVA